MPFLKAFLPVTNIRPPIGRRQWVNYCIKWLLVSGAVGAMAGTASAVFLVLLEGITQFRLQFPWLIYLLPIIGLFIGWVYHTWGKPVVRGTHLIVEEIREPSSHSLPWLMAPFILAATLLTHLGGGSAGREGTAAQMGGALADQFSRVISFSLSDRRTLLICGVSAGFASVFGTPWAGAIFGLEVACLGKSRWYALVPSMLAAFVADAVTTAWGVGHMTYPVLTNIDFSWRWVGAAVAAGLCFGLASRLFIWGMEIMVAASRTLVSYAPFRPVVGGVVVLGLTLLLGTDRYLGLGLPVLVEAFVQSVPASDFLWKLLFTVITLGFGFKGGEVTPLFFIGATLGNALFGWLPLPLELLVAMGFVAVFAGAANTPFTCILLAMELFGIGCGWYAALTCCMAFLMSPSMSIYGEEKNKWQILSFLLHKQFKP